VAISWVQATSREVKSKLDAIGQGDWPADEATQTDLGPLKILGIPT